MLAFEKILQRIIPGSGLDLYRYGLERSPPARLSAMLASHGVDLAFDVDANIGQFSQSSRAAGL